MQIAHAPKRLKTQTWQQKRLKTQTCAAACPFTLGPLAAYTHTETHTNTHSAHNIYELNDRQNDKLY